jgi:pimeloyl-ACP methyl ester carboxylesterase
MPSVRRIRRSLRRALLVPVGVAGALLATSCSSGPTSAQAPPLGITPAAAAVGTTTPPVVVTTPPIVWVVCPTRPTLQCGTVAVPLDYSRPTATTLSIAVTREPATGGTASAGTLLVNPGGPGESGNQILPVLLPLLPPEVRAASDVVSFDPRGTGASSPLRCGTVPATVTAALPVPAVAGQPLPGTSVFTGIAQACITRNPTLTPAIDTTATARDMDRIRQALGVSVISYYGLSYGTVLGAVYAELFPGRLRTMVLDGAVDINAPLATQASEQAPAAERSLIHLFTTCAADPSCPLGPNPRALYRRLSASMSAKPLPAPGHGDSVPVTVGDLDTAALFAVTVPGATSSFESAVVAASHGVGAGLRSLALGFVTEIDGTPLVEAQWAITCNDTVNHPGPVAAGTLARSLGARWPLLGGFAVNYNLGGCVAWPDGLHPVSNTHPRQAPPVLVIGNTGDPNTPLIGATHVAAVFPRASQLTWRGWGHTWLLSGSTDSCVQSKVTRYLLTGVLPAPRTICG